MFIFDGENKKVYIDNTAVINGMVSFTPEELWSRWMDWYLEDDNSKYPPAFRITGGDPIGSGQYIGNYLFFRNDLGWRIVPPTINGISIIINGAFYGEDPNLPVMLNNPNQETDLIINRSSMVTNTMSGGVNYSLNDIALAVWENITRTLTTAAVQGDVNIVSVKGQPVQSIDDFKADLSNVPQEVWEYSLRTLTQDIGLTPEQEAKLDQIMLDIETESKKIKNTVIATS